LRTQIAIIGGGPAGLLLSQFLHLDGIESIVLEKRSRAHVEARIRAGVLEPGTVKLLRSAGAAARLDDEGLRHDGFHLAFDGKTIRVDLKALAGDVVTVYGQTEITKDLNALRLALNGNIVFRAEDIALHRLTGGGHAYVTYRENGVRHEVVCDFVAGCDGFHGVSRTSIPEGAIRNFERVVPFGWLGVLSKTPPVADELIYARHRRGFALCSMRSRTRSRYYVQVGLTDRVEEWPDDRFWGELRRRIPPDAAERLVTGESEEKSIAPLRSFVAEPMRFGRLFLAGDAAHIMPPTGAKGLNLAASDAGLLAAAFAAHYRGGDDGPLDAYSTTALRRAWQAVRFSWWLTGLTHRLGNDPFEGRMQKAGFEALAGSRAAASALAENYLGIFPTTA